MRHAQVRPAKVLLPVEDLDLPSNTWVHIPNGISISSAVFAQLTVVTNTLRNRPAERPHYTCSNRRYTHAMHAMWLKNGIYVPMKLVHTVTAAVQTSGWWGEPSVSRHCWFSFTSLCCSWTLSNSSISNVRRCNQSRCKRTWQRHGDGGEGRCDWMQGQWRWYHTLQYGRRWWGDGSTQQGRWHRKGHVCTST